jgi:hypothetical protein
MKLIEFCLPKIFTANLFGDDVYAIATPTRQLRTKATAEV